MTAADWYMDKTMRSAHAFNTSVARDCAPAYLLHVVLIARRYRLGSDSRIRTRQIHRQPSCCHARFRIHRRVVVIVIIIVVICSSFIRCVHTAADNPNNTIVVIVVIAAAAVAGRRESALVCVGRLRPNRLHIAAGLAAIAVHTASRSVRLRIAGKVLAIVRFGGHEGRVAGASVCNCWLVG